MGFMNKFLFIELSGTCSIEYNNKFLIRMWIHGIRDKTFPSPVPQPNEKLKTGSLTKSRATDEELSNVQTTSSAALF